MPASSGLRRDPTLDLVASTHLAEVDAHPPAASYARVARLIGRYGDSLSRLRPFAALGADFSARRRALAPVLARSTRAFGFTHVGWAETRDALVVVFGRRAAEIGPPRVRAEGVTLTVRAPDDAPIEGFLRGPCPPAGPPCSARPRSIEAEPGPGRAQSMHFTLSGPGRWTTEVLVHGPHGPEIVHLGHWTREASRIRRSTVNSLPERRVSDGIGDWLASLRRRHGRAPARWRSLALARAALAHATRVCADRWARHRVDGAGPEDRARRRGFDGRVSEVVAIAPTLAAARQRLEDSPGHLASLLLEGATRYGAGTARGEGCRCLVVLLGR